RARVISSSSTRLARPAMVHFPAEWVTWAAQTEAEARTNRVLAINTETLYRHRAFGGSGRTANSDGPSHGGAERMGAWYVYKRYTANLDPLSKVFLHEKKDSHHLLLDSCVNARSAGAKPAAGRHKSDQRGRHHRICAAQRAARAAVSGLFQTQRDGQHDVHGGVAPRRL